MSDSNLHEIGRTLKAKVGNLMEIEAMTDSEVLAELDALTEQFSAHDFEMLETALAFRAATLQWTGDPLKQPPRAVLMEARRVKGLR